MGIATPFHILLEENDGTVLEFYDSECNLSIFLRRSFPPPHLPVQARPLRRLALLTHAVDLQRHAIRPPRLLLRGAELFWPAVVDGFHSRRLSRASVTRCLVLPRSARSSHLRLRYWRTFSSPVLLKVGSPRGIMATPPSLSSGTVRSMAASTMPCRSRQGSAAAGAGCVILFLVVFLTLRSFLYSH